MTKTKEMPPPLPEGRKSNPGLLPARLRIATAPTGTVIIARPDKTVGRDSRSSIAVSYMGEDTHNALEACARVQRDQTTKQTLDQPFS